MVNEARFWARVDVNGPIPAHRPERGPCAIWTGSNDGRYGKFGDEWAHRVASTLTDGPIPEGISVLHHCDNGLCVRRSHRFRGTQADNMRDMHAKGRGMTGDRHWTRLRPEQVTRGERHWAAKLTAAQVQVIRKRAAAGESQRRIAASYGVDQSNVSSIVRGHSWR